MAAVKFAEAGADFRDVYRLFLDKGHNPRESYQHAARVFRGSLPAGAGPFTKDLAYGVGFLAIRKFLHDCRRDRRDDLLPLLFCGKTRLGDLPALEQLLGEGLLVAALLHPPFREPANLKMLGLYGQHAG